MAVVQATARPGPGSNLLATYRTLRAEKAQLVRWRRLLRSRLDLAIASYAPPSTLGETTWDLLPTAHADLPLPQEITAAVTATAAGDQVALMEHLRHLDLRLTAYGLAIDQALESTTQKMVAALGPAASAPVEDDDLAR